MRWFLARLREPSTWAGLAVFGQAAQNVAIAPGGFNTANIVTAVIGLGAVLLSEKGIQK